MIKIKNQRGTKTYHYCMGYIGDVVIPLWVWIGHIGLSFSEQTLAKQQQSLREQYHLPYKPIIRLKNPSDPSSERNLLSNTANSTGS
ncbi:MAG TPA: hypothetical protein VFJ51_01740 [Nitrososphaeraceae archaeon]|nr:hypothetical protein [Nitrososphaeraceae archaeon]